MNQKTTQTPTATTTNKQVDHSAITKLPTFAQRGSAIATRVEAIKADPKFQALPAEHKEKVLANAYKKYVVPSYANYHLPVPDEQTWVKISAGDTTHRDKIYGDEKLSDTYSDKQGYWQQNKQSGQDIAEGILGGAAGIAMFGARATNYAFAKLHGLADYYSHSEHNQNELSRAVAAQVEDGTKRIQRSIANFEDAQQSQIMASDYWHQVHPRDTTLGKLDSSIGEFIATLPLYEALGTIGAGEKLVVGAGQVVSKVPLAAKLARTPVGQFVARRLIEASDGFTAGLVTSGGSTKEATGAAASFAVGGAALEGVGNLIKIASAPLIKKWTANTIAMGGKPFAQDISDSAWHEMQPLNWWLENGAKAGITEYKGALQLSHDLTLYHQTENTGFFVHEGKPYYYDGKKQQEVLYNQLSKASETARAANDPVTSKLHEAEKAALDSISIQVGGKPFAKLSQEQQVYVSRIRGQQITEAAAEAPAHLPDLLHGEVEHKLVDARKENPIFNSQASKYEKMGIKLADAETDSIVKTTKEVTGIKNQRAGGKKLAKVVKENQSASLNAKDYASFRNDTNAYLRAPRSRKQLVDSLGTKGQENWNAFYGELKKLTPGNFKFETPEHRMLYVYGDRDQLPKPAREALERRLRQSKAYEDYPPSQLYEVAKRLHNKIYQIARTGVDSVGDNLFASSRLRSVARSDKWTRQLSGDYFSKVTEPVKIALKQHPEALRAFMSTAKSIQKLANNAPTADAASQYTQQLEDHARESLEEINKLQF